MSEEEQRWWRNPQGIVAAATIATMIIGFFYIREKSMWELSSRIAALELRGSTAITQMGSRLERVETVISEIRDRVNFLERKIDHIEFDIKGLKDDQDKQYQKPYQ